MSIQDDKRGTWLRVIAALKREYPAPRPVSVRVRRLVDHDSTIVTYDDKSRIFISSTLDFDHACDALIHEYAHALSRHWRFSDHDKQHGKSWGEEVSRVYTFVTKFLENT